MTEKNTVGYFHSDLDLDDSSRSEDLIADCIEYAKWYNQSEHKGSHDAMSTAPQVIGGLSDD